MPLRLRLLPSPSDRSGPTQQRAIERTIELPDETREIRIGRRADIEVPLPYASLSGLHAAMTRTNGGWEIEDLGSTNGTRLDGEPLAPHRPRPVRPGAQIALGPVTVVFDGVAPSVRGAERTASIARRLVGDLRTGWPPARRCG
jgi:pSer/pThr/pTyr-binding forkhead associated (FHA) protein